MDIKYKKKVSVVIPNYNGSRFLAEALDSVLTQTYTNFEIIVIDDGSTDGSVEILERYAQHDARVRIVRNSTNKGISFSRNHGIMASNGCEYVAFLDSDDVMAPERIQKQVEYLATYPDVAAVGSWIAHINEEGQPQGVKRYRARWCGKDPRVLSAPLLAQSAVMIRRDIFETIGTYNEHIFYGEDYDLWLRMLSAGLCVGNIPEALTTYRIHEEQSTMARYVNQLSGFKVRWHYLFNGFFSLGGLLVTLGIGFWSVIPHVIRNKLRRMGIKILSPQGL